jgi:outer membrane immunogenic protein
LKTGLAPIRPWAYVKKLFVAGIAAAFCSTPALAADMAVKAPPPAPSAPVYSWTGFYVGANMGYGWNDPAVTFNGNDPTAIIVTCGGGGFQLLGTCVPPTSFNINGPLGGLQVGYNWQINQRWLLGLEADFDWSRIKGSGSSNFILAVAPSTFSASENVTRFGTVRARFGFLPTSTLLAYVTGGLAYGRVDENAALNSAPGQQGQFGAFGYTCAPTTGNNCFVGGSSRTATGWTLGGGFEYVLSQNISLKAEYLYVNLGHGDTVNVVAQSTAGLVAIPSSFSATYSTVDFNLVRGGLNYRF